MADAWTESEDAFQGYLLSNARPNMRRLFAPQLYPMVTRIAGNPITPEIDCIGRRGNSWIVGYEFKLLNSSQPGTNYNRIHSGIGQALSYFNYGVDFAYLVVGIPQTPDSERYLHKIRNTRALINFLSETHGFDRFQIWTYDGDRVVHPAADVRQERLLINGQAKLSRENILNGNISYSRAFLRKYDVATT